MSLYVFNNQQTVIKVIKYKRLIEGTQIQELNGTDELTVEIPNKDWDALEEEPLYLAIRDAEKRFSFHMYKIIQEDVNSDSVTVSGIQIGYDEMKAYGYIKDRRFTQASMQNVANAIVDGTDWQTGFVDSDLPSISTNFYYISRLEAIRKVIEANGCEVRFRVEITGNRIVAKRIDFLKRMSSDKGKRFSYGSKLLSVVKETDSAELYTALVGRGKGEEVGDGYGRRIGFEDIEWSIDSGDPVDKPLGQEFVELPEMTALYGFPDGEPRTSIVTFEDTEDEALLLEQTYEKAVEMSRPQVQFKASVQGIGDVELGETVSIVRHDLNFKYKTRIFKIKRDILDNNRTEVELGDRITESLGRTIRRIDTTNQRREERIVEYVQNTADGKNKIFRQEATPPTGMTVNDLWYKPVGEGETELYRWNGEIWSLEKVSAGLLGGTLDAENGDVNLINLNASSIVTGTLNALDVDVINLTADNIITGVLRSHNGNFSLDMDTGVVNMLDGNFEGRINADDGMVGGWRINNDVLYGELASGAFTSLKATGEVALAVNVLDPRVTSDARLQILHDGSIRFKSRSGGASTSTEIGRFERSGDYDFLIRGSRVLNLEAVAHVRVDADMRPNNNSRLLGSDAFRWYEIYVGGTGINQSSDARLKDNIKNVPEELLAGFLELEPKSYTIDGRQHFGYIAQDVERVMYKYGVEKYGFDNVADFMSSLNIVKKNESYLSLSYGQVEALKSAACKKEIDKLRQRLDEMEGGANE